MGTQRTVRHDVVIAEIAILPRIAILAHTHLFLAIREELIIVRAGAAFFQALAVVVVLTRAVTVWTGVAWEASACVRALGTFSMKNAVALQTILGPSASESRLYNTVTFHSCPMSKLDGSRDKETGK